MDLLQLSSLSGRCVTGRPSPRSAPYTRSDTLTEAILAIYRRYAPRASEVGHGDAPRSETHRLVRRSSSPFALLVWRSIRSDASPPTSARSSTGCGGQEAPRRAGDPKNAAAWFGLRCREAGVRPSMGAWATPTTMASVRASSPPSSARCWTGAASPPRPRGPDGHL